MKLNLLNLRAYKRFADKMREKGVQLFESVGLDLEAGFLWFPSNKYVARVKLNVEKEDGEPPCQRIFISSEKFFHLVSEYSHLTFKNNVFVSPEGDTFELSFLEDATVFPDMTAPLENSREITDPKSFSLRMKSAMDYTPAERNSPLAGVFLYKGHIVGTDRARFFDCVQYEDDELILGVPIDFLGRIMTLALPPNQSIKFEWNSGMMRFSIGDEFVIQSGISTELSLPDVTSAGFQGLFNHSQSVAFNFQALKQALAFLTPFAKDAPNTRICFRFEADGAVSIEVTDFNKVKKHLAASYSSFDYFKDQEIWMSCQALTHILGTINENKPEEFKGENLQFRIDLTQPGIDIRLMDCDKVHVVYSRLTDR